MCIPYGKAFLSVPNFYTHDLTFTFDDYFISGLQRLGAGGISSIKTAPF